MSRKIALPGAVALVLAGSIAVRAEIAPPAVSDAVIVAEAMPRSLSDYGFFSDIAAQTPASGVVPYRLNTPLYSDGAIKLRFVYVPPGSKISADGDDLLRFPVGSALIKTFAFGEGAERRLIETRVLLHRANGWVALPYLWNEAQTEARLAIAGARLAVKSPAGETISYRVPNKNQCKECHSYHGAVTPIGPEARNLDRKWMRQMGIEHDGGDSLPLWEDRAIVDAAAAAGGYLDVNCAHCHRPGGMASNSGLDLRWEQTDLGKMGVRKRPVAAGRGSGGLEFDIDPGHPERSIIIYRMNSTEAGIAMPELGKATVDPDGVAAVERWIAEMETP